MADKNYIGGSAKAVQTQHGEIMNLSLKLEDLQKIVNERGYCNISVTKRKEPSKYCDTHSVFENTYRPQPKPAQEEDPTHGDPDWKTTA